MARAVQFQSSAPFLAICSHKQIGRSLSVCHFTIVEAGLRRQSISWVIEWGPRARRSSGTAVQQLPDSSRQTRDEE